MITLLIISLVVFIIGDILIIVYFSNFAKDWIFTVGIILIIIGGISSIVLGVILGNQTNSMKIKEYPASEYTLSYKITEFEGQRDTTYVLIPKDK